MISLPIVSDIAAEEENIALQEIDNLDQQLQHHFQNKFLVQLESGSLSNAANLNEENQVASISRWLCSL